MRQSVCVLVFCFVMGIHSESLGGSPKNYLGCYQRNVFGFISKPYLICNPWDLLDDDLSLCKARSSHYALLFNKLNNSEFICHDDDPGASFLVSDDNCQSCIQNDKWTCGRNTTVAIYRVPTINSEEKSKIYRNNKSTDLRDKSSDRGMSEDFLLAMNEKGFSNLVELLNHTSHSYHSIAQLFGSTISAIDYHFRLMRVFASWNGQLLWFPMAGDENNKHITPDSFFVDLNSYCPTFTVDWVHDRIFWPVCTNSSTDSIWMVDLDSSNRHMLVELPEDSYIINDIAIDPYRGLLFWSTSNNTLGSVRIDGHHLKTVTVGTILEKGLALDMVAERVYFSLSSNTISYIHYNGSEVYNYTTAPLTHALVSFTVFKSEMYVMTREQPDSRTHLSKMYHNGTEGCLDMLLNTSLSYTHMKLVHPELQSPSRHDDCTDYPCSHHCVVEASVARCRCPEGYTLGGDKKTCKRGKGTNDTNYDFIDVMTGLGSILFIVLAAGVLMCLVDKLWSEIRPAVDRVTPNILKPQVVYRRTNSEVSLI